MFKKRAPQHASLCDPVTWLQARLRSANQVSLCGEKKDTGRVIQTATARILKSTFNKMIGLYLALLNQAYIVV